MKNKPYQTLESIGTVAWLITDFIWMCGYNLIAIIIGLVPMVFLIVAALFYEGDKKSERFVMCASAGWFLMNYLWIANEMYKFEMYLWAAKLFFLIACFFVYLSFKASKNEDEPTDFKRLKIK